MRLTHNKKCLIFCLFSLCLVTGFLGRLPSAYGCAACGDFGSDIYVHVQVAVQNNRMEQMDVRWDLSEILSQSLLEQYDVNRDGRLDTKETDALAGFFSKTLQPSDYFTTIFVNNRKLSAPDFENPRFEWQPTGAAFMFSMPLSYEINDILDLTMQVMDPDFHLMFYYRHDSVTWNRPEGYRLTHNAAVFPQALEISIQPENGTSVTTAPGAVPKQGLTQKSAVGPTQSNKNEALSWNGKLMTTLSVWLQDLHKRLKTYLYNIKTHSSKADIFWLILFAFSYGLLHAAGPGHGKTLVASYLISHRHPLQKAVTMSLLIGVVHVFSAFILTAGMLLILNVVFSTAMQQATLILTRLSGGLIILIAGYLAVLKIRAYAASTSHQASFAAAGVPLALSETPSCTCAACRPTSHTTDVMMVITAGIVPCPGTVTIFLFAISLQLYLVGFLAATAMSLGMGVVIFGVSFFSITMRDHLVQGFRRYVYMLEYAAILIILILGILLLLVDIS
jgi:nickel/cobalt transporter (NicO) family protein